MDQNSGITYADMGVSIVSNMPRGKKLPIFLHGLLFCPITLVSDNHLRFFFSRLDYFLGNNLKLRLKVSAVIVRCGHASLFVENWIVLL